MNNASSNLEVICPNCHALTPNYGSLNTGKGRPKRLAKIRYAKKHPLSSVQKHKKPSIQYLCLICKKTFMDTKQRKYCSQECVHVSQQKVTRPSSNELEIMIKTGLSWVKLGEHYQVTDNAVKKWAKAYDLI